MGAIIQQGYVHHREKKSRFQKITSLLKAAEAEVTFNKGKLETLSDFLKKNLPTVFPSFDLLPDFMDKLKSSLVEYPETSELVKSVGDLHYEIVHVQLELEHLRGLTAQHLIIQNGAGVIGLADKRAETAGEVKKQIASCLTKVTKKYILFGNGCSSEVTIRTSCNWSG